MLGGNRSSRVGTASKSASRLIRARFVRSSGVLTLWPRPHLRRLAIIMATATYPPMPTRRKTDTSDALCRRSTSQGGSQCLRFASLSKRAITRAPLVQGQPERAALPRTDQRRSLPSPFPSLLRVCQWQLSPSYCAPYQATRPPCRDPLSVLTGRLTGAAKRGAWVEPQAIHWILE